jgi:hypothetical protein
MLGAARVPPLDHVLGMREATALVVSQARVPFHQWTRAKWRRARGVPEHHVDRAPVFVRAELLAWIAAYRAAAPGPRPSAGRRSARTERVVMASRAITGRAAR